jgi:hypothetical protein
MRWTDAQEVTGRRSCYHWCLYWSWPCYRSSLRSPWRHPVSGCPMRGCPPSTSPGMLALRKPYFSYTYRCNRRSCCAEPGPAYRPGVRPFRYMGCRVTAFGRSEEIPSDIYRRIIETNLFGYIHGARAALPYFREQGSGTLINIASIDSLVGMPYTSAYVASKFAIRGFSESLREEMMGEPINICTIMPGSIDTPLFQHSANYSG